MKEPRPSVVSHKSDGDVVRGESDVDGITLDGVDIVVMCCPCAPHDVEGVLNSLSSQRI